MELLLRFWRGYCAKHTRSYLLGFLFLGATTGLTVAIPWFVELAVDAMERHGSSEAVGWAIAIIAAGLGVMGVRTLSRIFFFNPGREVEYDVKNALFTHLTRLPKRYFDRMRPGELISRGTNDAAGVRAFVGFASLQGLNVALTLLFTFGQMLLTNGLLTALCVGPILLAALVMRLTVKRMWGLIAESQEQVATLSAHALEAYNGASVLQSFNAVGGARARFERANRRLLGLGIKLVAITSWLLPVVVVIGNACLVLVLYAGGRMVVDGALSKGELAAFAVYIRILVGGLMMFGFVASSLQRGWVSLKRIFEVLDAPTGAPEATGALPARVAGGRAFAVRDLSFTHPTATAAAADHQALSGVSFEVAHGEVIGVFGLTGSGKTTLLDLIARTYEPPAGAITVDGVDVRDLPLPAYRETLAYVPQDAFLFSESIRDNIALAAPLDGRSDARVERAAAAAALTDDIAALPDGLDTRVGQRGITLSGGQRQRTALARAFYRPFDVLLLDDVLSAVDHATERRLIDAIYARAEGATTFVVSHRISVLKRADRVLVLDDGKLVAAGSHDDLLARGVEPYCRIHTLQQARAEADASPGPPPPGPPAGQGARHG